MAEAKKKTQTNSKAKAKKPVKAKAKVKSEYNYDSAMNLEMVSLLTVVGGILLGVFLYVPSGFLGEWIKALFLGLLGLPAYILPVYLIFNGIHHGINKKYDENIKNYILVLIGLVILSGIFHLFSLLDKMNPFNLPDLADYFIYGTEGYGGGLLGGILTDILRSMVGAIATGVILITVLIILIMIITKWSPVKALLRAIVRMARAAKKTGKEIKDEAILIPEQTVVEEQTSARGHKRFPNFSDEDVTRNSDDVKGRKMNTGDVPEKPYDEAGYLPESLRGVDYDMSVDIDNIDEILENAIPVFNARESRKTTRTIAENPPQDEMIEDYQPPAQMDSDVNMGDEEIIYPEKLEGMIDVSAEIEEEIFERIPYTYPDYDLLDDVSGATNSENSRNELKETAQKLIATLKSFNVEARLLNVSKGPTVTRYELKLGEGVKVSKIVGLSEDISLRLAANNVRIAPVPNKEAVGVEIPNKSVDTVHIREVIDSNEFRDFKSKLAFALGKDITGRNVVFDLAKMPHVLIAGATGSGKSVCINTLITSLIYKADPNEVKLLMVDPKVVELGIYNGIPHLLIPVVTDPRRASGALYWAVQEMVRRYNMFAECDVRNMDGYNEMLRENGNENTLPHIVIIIDELADLMMVAPNEVEDSICRLAQMARAAGMHLVIATQRPSVDVITGLIKANVPSRIAFSVSSSIDSRTILDTGGAEKLLGRGDMLFAPMGAPKPTRLQGAFISDKEVERVVEFIKHGSKARYDEDIMEKIENGKPVNVNEPNGDAGDNDELLPRAIEIAVDSGKISASYLQRRLKVGFSRAARMIDQMEERGWIGPPEGSKPREVLISKEDYMEMSLQ